MQLLIAFDQYRYTYTIIDMSYNSKTKKTVVFLLNYFFFLNSIFLFLWVKVAIMEEGSLAYHVSSRLTQRQDYILYTHVCYDLCIHQYNKTWSTKLKNNKYFPGNVCTISGRGRGGWRVKVIYQVVCIYQLLLLL